MEYYGNNDLRSYLALKHHGVKGQKWGVRHGPPYPIEDKVLKKGTKVNSVSSWINSDEYKRSGRPMYVYNPEDKWDSKVYKGPFSFYKAVYRGAFFLADHKYETVRDLKMPNKKERMQEFKDLYEDKKYRTAVIKDLSSIRKQLVANRIASSSDVLKQMSELDLKNISTDQEFSAAYEIFNHAMEAAYSHKSTAEYMKRMSSKYDAMVDDNNQGVYNDAHDPVVIFKANEVLKTIGSTPVKAEEIKANLEQVEKELAKKGKTVKL